MMDDLRVSVPEGSSGEWYVEKFTVIDEDVRVHNMRCAFKPGMGRRIMRAGTYTKLLRHRHLVMSDTPAEAMDHRAPIRAAYGSVLINGLGLGVVLKGVLADPEVTDVTVIEKSPDVIALVGPHYSDPRLAIIEADAMEWRPPKGKRYGMVWHDIWDDICADNLPQMHKLHRRYGRCSEWQGSWCRAECEMRR